MRGLSTALAAAVLLFAASSSAHAAPPLTVAINSCAGATVTGYIGTYPGGDAPGEMRMFLGVPYAAPPTLTNRWMPPQPVQCWSGDRIMNTFGATCPQGPTLDPWESEDCLTLNVFTKKSGSVRGLPVMVFIHGGGLTSGSGSFQLNPFPLIQKDVVVVTINYRVGALGFLASSRLTYKTGNFGLLDQQAALKWVKDNIARFGGDRANVTIFGQSAGGLGVLVQLLSAKSNGLFHKAIIESGAFYHQATPLAEAQSKGDAFAGQLSCSTATCLRGKSVAAILAAQNPTGQPPPLGQSVALVTQDNVVLNGAIKTLLQNGKFKKVPTIVGSTHDETRFHIAGNPAFGTGGACNFVANITPSNYPSKLQSTGVPSNMTGTVQAHYPPGGTDKSATEALAKQWTDNQYSCRTFRVNKWMAQKGGINFAYEFNDAKAPHYLWSPFKLSNSSIFPYGAYHGAELPYLFRMNSKDACGADVPAMTAMQRKLSAAMVTYWTTFAKTGNPNDGVLPDWPEFTATNGKLASFKGAAPVLLNATGAGSFDADHKCSAFWDANSP